VPGGDLSDGCLVKGLDSDAGISSNMLSDVPDQEAVDLLLGNTLVVRDRKAARRILASQAGTVRAVTMRGEVFSASGPVLAGKPARSGTLGRPRQRRELQDALANLERQIEHRRCADTPPGATRRPRSGLHRSNHRAPSTIPRTSPPAILR